MFCLPCVSLRGVGGVEWWSRAVSTVLSEPRAVVQALFGSLWVHLPSAFPCHVESSSEGKLNGSRWSVEERTDKGATWPELSESRLLRTPQAPLAHRDGCAQKVPSGYTPKMVIFMGGSSVASHTPQQTLHGTLWLCRMFLNSSLSSAALGHVYW